MPRLLASVADLAEARTALSLGADILDLKDPARGALGAWSLPAVAAAVAELGGGRPLSATIGDLAMDPAPIRAAVAAMAATGVDIVKIGFFAAPRPVAAAVAAALAPLAAEGVRLVAVTMADQRPDPDLLDDLAAAGFTGAMLDTADKAAGGLRAHLDGPFLARFVDRAKGLGLLTGLAGSLGLADIAPLAALGPDYLGFRGALCVTGRTSGLDPTRFRAVRAAVRSEEVAPLLSSTLRAPGHAAGVAPAPRGA